MLALEFGLGDAKLAHESLGAYANIGFFVYEQA